MRVQRAPAATVSTASTHSAEVDAATDCAFAVEADFAESPPSAHSASQGRRRAVTVVTLMLCRPLKPFAALTVSFTIASDWQQAGVFRDFTNAIFCVVFKVSACVCVCVRVAPLLLRSLLPGTQARAPGRVSASSSAQHKA